MKDHLKDLLTNCPLESPLYILTDEQQVWVDDFFGCFKDPSCSLRGMDKKLIQRLTETVQMLLKIDSESDITSPIFDQSGKEKLEGIVSRLMQQNSGFTHVSTYKLFLRDFAGVQEADDLDYLNNLQRDLAHASHDIFMKGLNNLEVWSTYDKGVECWQEKVKLALTDVVIGCHFSQLNIEEKLNRMNCLVKYIIDDTQESVSDAVQDIGHLFFLLCQNSSIGEINSLMMKLLKDWRQIYNSFLESCPLCSDPNQWDNAQRQWMDTFFYLFKGDSFVVLDLSPKCLLPVLDRLQQISSMFNEMQHPMLSQSESMQLAKILVTLMQNEDNHEAVLNYGINFPRFFIDCLGIDLGSDEEALELEESLREPCSALIDNASVEKRSQAKVNILMTLSPGDNIESIVDLLWDGYDQVIATLVDNPVIFKPSHQAVHLCMYLIKHTDMTEVYLEDSYDEENDREFSVWLQNATVLKNMNIFEQVHYANQHPVLMPHVADILAAIREFYDENINIDSDCEVTESCVEVMDLLALPMLSSYVMLHDATQDPGYQANLREECINLFITYWKSPISPFGDGKYVDPNVVLTQCYRSQIANLMKWIEEQTITSSMVNVVPVFKRIGVILEKNTVDDSSTSKRRIKAARLQACINGCESEQGGDPVYFKARLDGCITVIEKANKDGVMAVTDPRRYPTPPDSAKELSETNSRVSSASSSDGVSSDSEEVSDSAKELSETDSRVSPTSSSDGVSSDSEVSDATSDSSLESDDDFDCRIMDGPRPGDAVTINDRVKPPAGTENKIIGWDFYLYDYSLFSSNQEKIETEQDYANGAPSKRAKTAHPTNGWLTAQGH